MAIAVNIIILVLVAAIIVAIYRLGQNEGFCDGMKEAIRSDSELFTRYEHLIAKQHRQLQELTDEVERMRSDDNRTTREL